MATMPQKLPGRGMPMKKGVSAPPPFPVPMPRGAPPPMAAPGYAQGTTDVQTNPQVPAPGQTITGGSWEGPAPQTPATPSLGGQNQNLRQSLGMGVPRFAEGTPDVQQPLPQQENLTFGQRRVGWNPPKPGYAKGTEDVAQNPTQGQGGYNPQTGLYNDPPLDNHFVAHLRAAIGLAPKGGMPGYADGTSDVAMGANGSAQAPPTLPSPASVVAAPQPQPQQYGGGGWTPPSFAMPDAAQSPDMAAMTSASGPPAQMAAQGPSAVEKLGSFILGTPQHQADIAARSTAAAEYGKPENQAWLTAHPEALATAVRDPVGFLPKLQDYMAATKNEMGRNVTHTMPDGSTMTKQSSNPDLVKVISGATNYDPAHVNLMLHPGDYTASEFEQAAASMPWAVGQHLWGMQHYLTPQQQFAPAYLGSLQNESKQHASEMAAATKAGDNKAYTIAQTAKQKADAALQEAIKNLGYGPNWAAGMVGQQEQQ